MLARLLDENDANGVTLSKSGLSLIFSMPSIRILPVISVTSATLQVKVVHAEAKPDASAASVTVLVAALHWLAARRTKRVAR